MLDGRTETKLLLKMLLQAHDPPPLFPPTTTAFGNPYPILASCHRRSHDQHIGVPQLPRGEEQDEVGRAVGDARRSHPALPVSPGLRRVGQGVGTVAGDAPIQSFEFVMSLVIDLVIRVVFCLFVLSSLGMGVRWCVVTA